MFEGLEAGRAPWGTKGLGISNRKVITEISGVQESRRTECGRRRDEGKVSPRGALEARAGFCPWTPLKSKIPSGLWLQQGSKQLDTEKNFLTMKTESALVKKVGVKPSSPSYSPYDPGQVTCSLYDSVPSSLK